MTALHAQENTTIAEQAQQAGLDELWGLGFDYHKGFDTRIEAVKLADVVQAARRVLPRQAPGSPPRRKRDRGGADRRRTR